MTSSWPPTFIQSESGTVDYHGQPASGTTSRNDKNADTFFPPGWLRIGLAKFLEQPIILVRPRGRKA